MLAFYLSKTSIARQKSRTNRRSLKLCINEYKTETVDDQRKSLHPNYE